MLTCLPFPVAESYITHIRILEDGAYQSSPPPPNASTDQKKPRVIIVAVRKSGRVRMHKARENGNGTFSIGKTWPLDDLTAVESFSSTAPTTPEAELRRQWAGGVGFIATIGKPYYWQANTPKEKQFFIGSLVKIYMKYTGGKAPELIGFDDQEKDQLLGRAPGQSRPPALNKPGQPSQPPRLVPRQRPPGPEQKSSFEPGPTSDAAIRPPTSNSRMQLAREDSETGLSTSRSIEQQQAPPRLRKPTGDNQSQEPPTSRDGGLPPRSRGGLNGTANVPGRLPDRTGTPASQRTLTPDNTGAPRQATPVDELPIAGNAPPERRRPPLQISSERSLSTDNMVPAPLATPSSQREFVRPPARSTDRPEAPQPLRVISPSSTSFGAQRDRPGTAPMKPLNVTKDSNIAEPPVEEPSQAPAEPAPEVPKEPLEDARPGLGPMIKKKSRADVASAFRKAATAASVANSFKPRAGGAAEKLREQAAKSPEGPDGINGVVPAPKMRSISNDSSRRKPSDHMVSEEAIPPIADGPLPEVKITVAPTDKADTEQTPSKSISMPVTPQKKPRDTKRPKPTEETQKQLSSLGVEASILDDRGATFATLLDDFGWMGDGIHAKSIDQMNDEIDRELNQAQIGGWLSRFEEEDDRIDAIRRGLDISIAECEELDGLLTLYGVELGVGTLIFHMASDTNSFRR